MKKKADVHLDLRLLMFLKFMKKSMSISLGTCEKRGVSADLENEYEQGRANFLVIFVKKALVFIGSTNLRLRPGMRLTKKR